MTAPALTGVETLLFDVMGTVVDDEGMMLRELALVMGDELDATAAARAWQGRMDAAMEQINSGAVPWRSHRQLRRAALDELVSSGDLPALEPAALDHLAAVTERFTPWPDSPAALASLRQHVRVVALSNAGLDELAQLSRHADLAWHAVVSGAFAHRYKPDHAVYEAALDLLGVEPARVLMVAAHPWDLRAAAEVGMATAYVGRPGAERPSADDRFTLHVDDLADLARVLARA